jgi:hypothetical protein
MTLSIDTRGAANGLREYGRVYLGSVTGIGAHAAADATNAPAPSDFSMARRVADSVPTLLLD